MNAMKIRMLSILVMMERIFHHEMYLPLSLSLTNGSPKKALGGRRRAVLMEDMMYTVQ